MNGKQFIYQNVARADGIEMVHWRELQRILCGCNFVTIQVVINQDLILVKCWHYTTILEPPEDLTMRNKLLDKLKLPW
jgi:hypothetical protein